MSQEYDKNISENRGTNVLSPSAEILKTEGFWEGTADIKFDDIQVTTVDHQATIKVGFSDVYLYVTVTLPDQTSWTTELEDRDYQEILPNNSDLLNSRNLQKQLTALKQRRYERMMEAIAWTKSLMEAANDNDNL